MSSKDGMDTTSPPNATSPRGRTTKAYAPLESTIQADIRVALGKLPHVVLWRNNTGAFRTENGRMMRTGLCVGSSDLIGILAPMGRFLALEVKRPGEKPTKEQELFLELVRKSGGVAAVVTSVEEALAVVGGREDRSAAMSDVLRFVREARACVGGARWADDDCLPCLDAALNRAELAATAAIDNGTVRP